MPQERRVPSICHIPTVVLRAGTPLWHGTDCEGDFLHPDGPAWFAFSPEKARSWAGWSYEVPTGRTKGIRRVLAFEVASDLSVLDTRQAEHWESLCELAMGDPEGSPWGTADVLFRKKISAGWYGRTEVLLTSPSTALTAQGCVWSAEAADAPPRQMP